MFFVWDDDDYLFIIDDWTDRLCFLIDVDDDRTTDEDGRFRILGT